MEEETDAVFHAQAPQFAGEGNQVVVMHPQVIIFADQGAQALGEMGVYA